MTAAPDAGMTAHRHRRVHVLVGDRPSDDRFILLTSNRLLSTPVWVVGVIDGTGRLAVPGSLLTTTNYERARRHANRLFEDHGAEEVQQPYIDHIDAGIAASRRQRAPVRNSPRPPRQPGPPLVSLVPPQRTKKGNRWVVRWARDGQRRMGRRFDIQQDAQTFYNRLAEEMRNR